jgi:hypothetical protein
MKKLLRFLFGRRAKKAVKPSLQELKDEFQHAFNCQQAACAKQHAASSGLRESVKAWAEANDEATKLIRTTVDREYDERDKRETKLGLSPQST